MATDGQSAKSKDKASAPPPAGGWEQRVGSVLVYRGQRQDNSQAWLLTFTDLAALMLTFFVLLFSMSTINDEDWQNLIDALSPQMASLQEVTVALPTTDKAAEEVERVPGTDLGYLAAVMKEQMAANNVLAGAQVRRDGDRLVVSVPGDLLFAPGAIELGKSGEKAIFALAGVLRNLRNVIEIAGHADPTQPHTAFPSNWELSLARAAVVSGQLSELGYAGSIVVRGYGDSRYSDIDSELTAEERLVRARRVDFIIHDYAAEVR